MNNILTAVFEDDRYCRVSGAWQYDYGQILRIQGLNLPKAVEIHFSLTEKSGESITRIGTTKDGATDVLIPDSMLEKETNQNYSIYAFIYLSDTTSGNTEYRIAIMVNTRPKPEIPGPPEEPEIFRETIEAVNQAADRSEKARDQAEAWAHGRGDYPEQAKDNAKYYAGEARKAAESVPGRVEEGKRSIDNYVKQKETELKGDTGNVFFTAFRVVAGRLKMYSDPTVDKVCFRRVGSRLKYRLKM
jgi:hypothetical protein